MTGKLKNFINGEWKESCATQYLSVPNPATGEEIAQVPIFTKEDVHHAVSSTRKLLKFGARHRFRNEQESSLSINNY